MHHIEYCLEETLAEIDAALDSNCLVQALKQLNRREAEGDPVVAIDPAKLREHIIGQIRNSPLHQARDKIVQARALVHTALAPVQHRPAKPNLVLVVTDTDASPENQSELFRADALEATKSRTAPHFKSMQERLAEAIGTIQIQQAEPKRA